MTAIRCTLMTLALAAAAFGTVSIDRAVAHGSCHCVPIPNPTHPPVIKPIIDLPGAGQHSGHVPTVRQ